jgi:hypothetical protein
MNSKFLDAVNNLNLVNVAHYERLYDENLKFNTLADEKSYLRASIEARKKHIDELYDLLCALKEEEQSVTKGKDFFSDDRIFTLTFRRYKIEQCINSHKELIEFYEKCLDVRVLKRFVKKDE